MVVVTLVFTFVFITTELKEEIVEPVLVNFTCPFEGVVKLDSSILVCKNGADLYCKGGNVVCMKEITHPEVVIERLCIVVC